MKKALEDVMRERRSVRRLEQADGVTREQIERAVALARQAPSAYNAQTSRLVILLQKENQKFWDIVENTLRGVTAEDAFSRTQKKLEGFRGGNGTILFYEDGAETEKLKQSFPLYADKFGQWAQHNNAILQYAVWLALTGEGLAASLQHYNPLIDAETAQEWNIPTSWTLIAQMPFGKAAEQTEPKNLRPMEETVKFFG